MQKKLKTHYLTRRLRTRSKIKKTNSSTPRLSVFRSHKHIYGQLIAMVANGKVLVAASDRELKEKKGTKTELAYKVGQLLAQKARKKNFKKVVFDKGSYSFKGRVKALAQGAREEGMTF